MAASAAATVSTNMAKIWPDQIVQKGGEGDEIDVHRQQDQLDRHQDDDDVLAVEEDAEHAEREQDRGDGRDNGQDRCSASSRPPARGWTLTISMRRRAACARSASAMFCRRTSSRCAQGQHDGADHRDQQDQPGGLEQIDIVGVEQLPERRGVGQMAAASAAPRAAASSGATAQAPTTSDQLDQQRQADQRADRQILQEALRSWRNRCRASSRRTGTAPPPRRHRR